MSFGPGERELLRVLADLASASRSYRLQVEAVARHVELLSEDYAPAADLSSAIMVALATGRPQIGTPADLELRARGIIADLGGAGRITEVAPPRLDRA